MGTNADHQQAWRERQKAKIAGLEAALRKASPQQTDAALARELAAAKVRIAELEKELARAQASNRELKAALEAAKSAKNPTPVVRKGYTQAEFDLVLSMLEAHCKSDDLNTRAAALEAVKLFRNTEGSFTRKQLKHPFFFVLHSDRNRAEKAHEAFVVFREKELGAIERAEQYQKRRAAQRAEWARKEAEKQAKRKAAYERRKAEKAAEQKRHR